MSFPNVTHRESRRDGVLTQDSLTPELMYPALRRSFIRSLTAGTAFTPSVSLLHLPCVISDPVPGTYEEAFNPFLLND